MRSPSYRQGQVEAILAGETEFRQFVWHYTAVILVFISGLDLFHGGVVHGLQ